MYGYPCWYTYTNCITSFGMTFVLFIALSSIHIRQFGLSSDLESVFSRKIPIIIDSALFYVIPRHECHHQYKFCNSSTYPVNFTFCNVGLATRFFVSHNVWSQWNYGIPCFTFNGAA